MAWFDNALRFLGFAVCHTLPSRSIALGGVCLPLCARCTGIYLGITLSYAYLLVRRGFKVNALPPLAASIAIVAMLLPMAVDGVTSYAGLRETNNTLRFVTGLAAGGALPIFAFPLLSPELVLAEGKRTLKRPFERWFDYAIWLAALSAGAVVLTRWPALYYPVATLAAAGLLAIFTNLAYVVWEMILERVRRGRRPWTVLAALATVALVFVLLNLFHGVTLRAMVDAAGAAPS